MAHAMQLTRTAQDQLLNDINLFKMVADITKLPPRLLLPYINRNSIILSQFAVVQAIANYLQVAPGALQEPRKPRKPRQTTAH